MRVPVLTLLLVFGLESGASGVEWSPDCCGFSADFPVTPVFFHPRADKFDAKGNKLSATTDEFACIGQKNYIALVNVDRLSNEVDAASQLTVERDRFLAEASASLISSRTAEFQGAPAVTFTFTSKAKDRPGQGMVVVRSAPATRIYLITWERRADASAEDIASLEKFFHSFKLR